MNKEKTQAEIINEIDRFNVMEYAPYLSSIAGKLEKFMETIPIPYQHLRRRFAQKVLETHSMHEEFLVQNMHWWDTDILWSRLMSTQKLSEDFLGTYLLRTLASGSRTYDTHFGEKRSSYDGDFCNLWNSCESLMFQNQQISEAFIEKWCHLLDWELIFTYCPLSDDFLNKHLEQVKKKTEKVCRHQTLSEKFMEDNRDWLDWGELSVKQQFSEEFIRKHWHTLKPYHRYLAIYQKMSVDFILSVSGANAPPNLKDLWNSGYVAWDWENILRHQEIPESLFEWILNLGVHNYYKRKQLWEIISEHQKMSEEFIELNKHNISWSKLANNGNTILTPEFIAKYQYAVKWVYNSNPPMM